VSYISITPIYFIGTTSTVAETITTKAPEPPPPPEAAPPAPPVKTTYPPPTPNRTIDAVRIEKWAAFIGTLETTDEIIDRTLTFFDSVFGPALFLRKRKDALAPYRFSPSISAPLQEKMGGLALKPPRPVDLWECFEKGSICMFNVPSVEHYREIVEINADAGWEEHPQLLIIPVTIASSRAGVLISVPTRQWINTPELNGVFETIASTLSQALTRIIMEKKRART